MTDACNIQVAIRVRQLIEKELQNGLRSHWTIKDNAIFCDEADNNGKKVAPYIFDQIFDEQSVTMDVFEDICKPIVGSALEGFNGTIFCYGQSSSGKTFTMSGTKMQPGVVRLSVEEIFNKISSIQHKMFLIRVGYMEIYNEQVTDLLKTEESVLKIREDVDHNIVIPDLKEEMVNSLDQVVQVVKKGDANRHTAETKQNDRSSRSHCILRVVIESRDDQESDDEPVNVSHLYFVDLAGSEKAGENSGDRFKEGCAINKSLFALGNVIRKLSGDENLQHVTTRDSKLTRLLKNALGGNSKTAIICTITPASIQESDSTLKFASRAKVIKNKAKVNEVVSDAAMLKRYRNQIKEMERKMKELSNTDTHMVKAELEKKLKEKEDVEQNQAQLIQHLQKMIVISGVEDRGSASEVSRKRRRETWCPGKAARGLNKVSEKPFLPMLEEISSPPPKKRSADSSDSFKLSKTLPLAPPLAPTLAPPPDMDTSLQLLDNVPAYRASINPMEDTINNNPYIKQLFELEDKHEQLQEELKGTKMELRELQEFTELERQCEKETIYSLKKIDLQELQEFTELERQCEEETFDSLNMVKMELKEMTSIQSNVSWMEEELMKTQQERNRLRSEVESKNRQLTAVEDGSGLTERNKQLTDAETRVTSLSSDMDVQKSRYEFHIAQMKSKLELYTNLLEEHGVNPELIKQRTGGDAQVSNEVDDLMSKHEQEVNELRNEVDSYVQKLEKEQLNQAEMIEQYEAKFEKQNERYQRDIKDMEDEKEVFRQMFEEERAKTSENETAVSSDEINTVKMKYEDEIQVLKTELQRYVELLEAENLRTEGLRENETESQIECLKQTHETEMNELKKEVEKYSKLLEIARTESEEMPNKDSIIMEMESLKQSHDSEINKLNGELNEYIDLLATEKQRVQELEEKDKNRGNDQSPDIEVLTEKYQEEINDLKAEVDKYVDLLYAEREKAGEDDNVENNTKSEMETLKQVHEVEVQRLQDKIDEYEGSLVEERLKVEEAREKLLLKAEDEPRIKDLEEDLEMYKDLLIEEQNKNTRNAAMEIENDVTVQSEKSGENGDVENNRKSEIKSLKQSHELEVQRLQKKIDEYEETIVEERLKVEESREKLLEIESEKSSENGDVENNRKSEIKSLKQSHELEVQRLQNKIDEFEETIIEERLKVEEAKEELDTYMTEKSLELEKIHQKYDDEVREVKAELKNYMEAIDTKNIVSKEGTDNEKNISTDIEAIKQKYETEIKELRTENDQYRELVNAEVGCAKENEGMDMNSELLKAEYEHRIKDLEEDLEMYKDLLIEEQNKNTRSAAMEIENDVTVDNFTERDIQGLNDTKGNMDLQTELLRAQSENVDKVQQDDLQSELLASEMNKLKEKYQAEIDTLREELERHKDLLEQEKRHNKEELDDPNGEVIVGSSSTGRDDSSEVQDGGVESIKLHLKEAEQKYSQLEQEQREEKASFEQQRLVYETTIKDTEDELHSFRSAAQELSTEIDKLQSAYKSLKEDKVNLLNEKCALEEKVEGLEMHTPSSEMDSEGLEERRKLRKDKETLERKIEDNIAEIHRINEIKSELEEKCVELNSEAENQKLERERLEEINNRLQQEKEEADRKIQECTSEIDRINKVKSELEGKCADLSSEVDSQKSEQDRHEERNNRLQQERDETDGKIEELMAEIDRMNNIKLELEARCEELSSEAENHKSEKERLNELNSRLQQEKYESDGHQAEVGSEIEKFQIQKCDMEKRTQELVASVERLEILTRALREENEMVVQEKAEIRGELESLETDNSGMKEELEKLAAKVESLEADSVVLKEENGLLKEETERKVEVYEETLQELKVDLNAIEEENLKLRNTLAQRSGEVSDTNSEITQLKTHVNELEEDAKVSAELIAEYDNEVKQLKEKLETLEVWKREDSEKVRLDWQEKYEKCVTERDNLAEQLNAIENSFKEETETCKKRYDETISDLREKNDNLDNKIQGLSEEMVELREKLMVSESESARLIKELKMANVSKDMVEDTKDRLDATEAEKNKLVKLISELRNDRARSRDGEASEVTELTEKLRATEAEVKQLKESMNRIGAEKVSAEKMVKELEESKTSLEEDLYQAKANRPKNSLRINIVESNKEFEEKWDTFVKDEKRKRVGLMREFRDTKIELQKETERRENAVTEAMKRVKVEIRNSDVYKELHELYKKAEDDANKLNSDLLDEKEKTQKLEMRLTEAEKVTEELRKKVSELEKNAKTSTGSGGGSGFIEGSHSCDYWLEMNSLKRRLKESEECIQKRDKEFENCAQRQDKYVASLKNEIRRLQSLDTTFQVSCQPNFNDSTGSSTKKPKTQDVSGSSMTDVSGCGSSSSGGIIDHFKVLVTETENKRLKKENQKQAEKIQKQTAKLEKLDVLEKENVSLKRQLERATLLKKKADDSALLNSEQRNPLEGVQQNAESSSECIFRPDPLVKQKSKPRFEIPDLEPKKPDNKFIVDGEDLNEKVDNCKSQ